MCKLVYIVLNITKVPYILIKMQNPYQNSKHNQHICAIHIHITKHWWEKKNFNEAVNEKNKGKLKFMKHNNKF